MTSVFFIALFSQTLLVLSGLALLQLINFKERIRILTLIPYAWGTGAILLYLAGGIFVKSEWLPHDWHFAVACGMAVLIVAGTIVHLQRQPTRSQAPSPSIRWYDALIIVLIVFKVGLVAYICMVNSVMDSDATDMRRYIALAKKISEGVSFSEVIEQGPGHKAPLGPSLLSAWIRMFLDRWHDSVASLPWLLAWLFSGCIASFTCYRVSRHFTASLVCGYLFLSLPLAATHVFRSGFHDLLVMYFFIIGIGTLSLAFLSREKPDLTWLALTIVAVAGTALCKSEGKVWALLLAVMWINYYLYTYKNVPWSKLIVVQISMAGVLFLIHQFVLDESFFRDLADPRHRLMAPSAFDERAITRTLETMFLQGSFGTWWWSVILAGCYFLLSRETPANTKSMVFFIFSTLLAVFYFANFTGNIKYTLISTNVSRFLLQLAGLLIPLYCALILTWVPASTNVVDTAREVKKKS